MLLKTKIFLSFSFLFLLFLIMGGMGINYLYQLADASEAIMKDNYRSVNYAEQMLKNFDRLHDFILKNQLDTSADNQTVFSHEDFKKYLLNFQSNLLSQRNNITEKGEKELTDSLSVNFKKYLNLTENALLEKAPYKKFYQSIHPLHQQLRGQIEQIFALNMQAIVKRNETALKTSTQVTLYIRIIMVLGIVISVVFILFFPSYLSRPLVELTEKIKAIANRNYDQKININSQDEIGDLANSFNLMALRLKEYDASNLNQIILEKKRTEAIIRTLNEAILVLDENLQIIYANPLIQRILGLNETELIKEYAPNIAEKNDLLKLLIKDLMIPLNVGEDLSPQETIKIFVNQKESFFVKEILEIKLSDYQNPQKSRLVGFTVILRNITHFKELDQAKTNFIATVSHELKTPLASIKMSTQLLNNQKVGDLNTEQKSLLHHIDEDAERMLKMVGELLSLSQIETGNIQLKKQLINVSELVNYVCQTISVQAEQKNIQIISDFAENDLKAIGDLEKTSWVMINLLSNAIRYSPENQHIIIKVEEIKKNIQISVQDFGAGIDPRYREKIFEKFFQIPKDTFSRSGTGLGLAISKEFINSQEGQIWVESEVGKGSTFYFTLPIAKQHLGFDN